MSAVVKAVTSVFKAVGDVVEAVGNVVVDVVDTVVETIEYVAKNPEIIVISVAAPALLPYIGVTGAAVAPVTAGLISASQGGDLEDIGKAALTAYVAPQVGAKVGRSVSSATAGSSLQNTLASAAASGATAGTAAAIQGGDIGQSILIGAAGGAGGALAREAAIGTEYDVPFPSQQAAQLASQEMGINKFAEIAADIGSSLGRSVVTGDVAGELERGLQSAASRESADFLREAFATSTGSDEVNQAEEIVAEAAQTNPIFAEDLQVAQIAVGDDLLTTDEKLDILAESLAREEFDKVKQSEDVAILPFFAAPLVGAVGQNLLRSAAVNSAPSIVARLATIAAQSPRAAQVMVTNPFVQQTLAAAGISVTIVGGIGVVGTAYDLLGRTDTGGGATIKIEPITSPSMDRLEEARQLRYAADIAETIPNADKTYATELKSLATNSEQLVQTQNKVAQLNNLKSQGFSVNKELERVQVQAQQLIPMIEAQSTKLAVPIYNVTTVPAGTGARGFEIFDVPSAPATRPAARPGQTSAPGITAPIDAPTDVPGVTPADLGVSVPGREEGVVDISIPGVGAGTGAGTGAETGAATGTGSATGTGVGAGTQAAGGSLAQGPGGPVATEPLDIEDLFRDEDILDFIRQGLGDDFVTETTRAAELDQPAADSEPDIGAGEAGGARAPTDVRPAVVGRTPTPVSVTSRAVSTGESAITGMKEPIFGGDPGQQQDVWNVRSLRLRKALGL